MASPTAQRRSVVIDLVSDSDDESDGGIELPLQDPPPIPPAPQQAAPGAQNFAMDDFVDFAGGMPGGYPDPFPDDPMLPEPARTPPPDDGQLDGEYLMIDGEQVFIPNSPGDSAMPAVAPDRRQHQREEPLAGALNEPAFTADDCLQHVLAVLPDVSHEHVQQLYSEMEASVPGSGRVENIIDKLLTAESYPKRTKGKQKKRKREDEEDAEAERKRWEGPGRQTQPNYLKGTTLSMLKAEFPEATQNLIAEQMHTHRHLYQAYVAIARLRDGNDASGWRGRAPKGRLADADTIAANSGSVSLSDELKAARKQVERIRADRRAEDAKKQAEQENLQRAIDNGELAECQACFEELPMNRQIHCNGDTAHFTCFDCAQTYIKSEVGDSRCRVLCTAGCGASFAHDQLHQLSDKTLLDKLEQLQQEKDIRDAGLDDLEECPFCDYKAILPPIEQDFEFRCMNPHCEKTSCRRCKSVSHIPQSCEDFARENKLSTRHKIEEAMTAAMIRSCNKCKKQFIKDYGCNKMSCPSCGNLQCYVCSESLKNYDHFDQGPGYGGSARPNAGEKKCPLYDNVEERHEREVKEAEAAARAQAMADNPDVSERDLEIKVSDAVQQATRDRIQRGAAGVGGIPAPPAFGGLFARMPRFPAFMAQYGANDDEDFEDDDNFFGELFDADPRRRNLAAAHRHGRIARLAHQNDVFQGDAHRLDGPAEARLVPEPRPVDPRRAADHQLADPRVRHQAAPLAHQAAVNPPPVNAAIPRMQGFIPVFGLQQHLPQPAAQPPAAPLPQQVQPGAGGGGHGNWGRFGHALGLDQLGIARGFMGRMPPDPNEEQMREHRRRQAQQLQDMAAAYQRRFG